MQTSTTKQIKPLLDSLLAQGRENEWLEFKRNNNQPQLIGEYFSILINQNEVKR
ncbi:MAG: hypothetical protein U9R66_11100 [Thermodesulfobacteriota bacterium]|nr:hypothetical protein [Thermodesulfobacteriota bacterium]